MDDEFHEKRRGKVSKLNHFNERIISRHRSSLSRIEFIIICIDTIITKLTKNIDRISLRFRLEKLINTYESDILYDKTIDDTKYSKFLLVLNKLLMNEYMTKKIYTVGG